MLPELTSWNYIFNSKKSISWNKSLNSLVPFRASPSRWYSSTSGKLTTLRLLEHQGNKSFFWNKWWDDKCLKLRHFLTTFDTQQSVLARPAKPSDTSFANNVRVVRHSRQAADTVVCRKPAKLPESNTCNKRGFEEWVLRGIQEMEMMNFCFSGSLFLRKFW